MSVREKFPKKTFEHQVREVRFWYEKREKQRKRRLKAMEMHQWLAQRNVKGISIRAIKVARDAFLQDITTYKSMKKEARTALGREPERFPKRLELNLAPEKEFQLLEDLANPAILEDIMTAEEWAQYKDASLLPEDEYWVEFDLDFDEAEYMQVKQREAEKQKRIDERVAVGMYGVGWTENVPADSVKIEDTSPPGPRTPEQFEKKTGQCLVLPDLEEFSKRNRKARKELIEQFKDNPKSESVFKKFFNWFFGIK